MKSPLANKEQPVISPYDYLDYRELLTDLYQDRKSQNRGFSHRYIAKKLGVSSAGYFSKVLTGRIHLSGAMTLAIARLFGFRKHETHYFELLVQYHQADKHEERKYYFERLIGMRRSKAKNLTEEQYELYSNWYCAAILELLDFYMFSDNYAQLASSLEPSITEAQAKKAIAILERLQLIRKNPDGFYEKTDAIISAGENWKSLSIMNFQKETMNLAQRALDAIPKERRDISTLTLSISEDSVERIKEKIRDMRRELLEIARADERTDAVYQVNLQLFPLTAQDGRR